MAITILSSPLVKDMLLPFLLVFAIVFAVLQKSKIFGEGKKQIDAIVSVVVALLVVAVGTTTHIITSLMPILAVGLVALLAFMLMWGFAFKEGTFDMGNGVRWTIGVLAAVVVVVSLIYFTPAWDYIRNMVSGQGSNVLANVIFIVLIVAGVIAVVYGGKKKEEK